MATPVVIWNAPNAAAAENSNMNYFELHLAGKNGYSVFVKSETIEDPDEALEKAVEKGVLPLEDAKEIARCVGYAQVLFPDEVEGMGLKPEQIHLI
jgi:hypothetical protein